MINRDLKNVIITSYTADLDAYGQGRQTVSSTVTFPMCVKIYSQTNQASPIYNEVELIAIAKSNCPATLNDTITVDSVKYNILHIIPSGRYTQLLLKAL